MCFGRTAAPYEGEGESGGGDSGGVYRSPISAKIEIVAIFL